MKLSPRSQLCFPVFHPWNSRHTFLLFLCIILHNLPLFAQELKVDSLYEYQTAGPSNHIGRFVQSNGETISFKSLDGKLVSFPKNEILSYEPIEAKRIKNGKYYPPDRVNYRNFFSTTSFGMPRRELHYRNLMVVGNFLDYGVTKNFSIGGGIMPFLFSDGGGLPILITPKINLGSPSGLIHISLSSNLILRSKMKSKLVAVTTPTLTLGTETLHVSFGLGFISEGTNLSNIILPAFGLQVRVSPKSKLIVETFFLPNELNSQVSSIPIVGLRTSGRRSAFDYGFVITGESVVPIIPWFGFSITGKKKS